MRLSVGGWVMAATPVDEHNKFHCNVSYYQCRQYVKYNSSSRDRGVRGTLICGLREWQPRDAKKVKITKWEMQKLLCGAMAEEHKNSFWKLLLPTAAPACEAQINNDANGVDGATRLYSHISRCSRVGADST